MIKVIEKPKVELFSKRQLQTIASIPTATFDLHCGPMGCGKTYSIDIGLGVACSTVPPPQTDSCIALIGKTAATVKNNIGNVLASKFGSNFRYDTGKKDGYTKDAVLFGHRIRIIGFNDSGAEDRIRGLNTYKIIGDEVSTWGMENFLKVQARLRGETPVGWELGFIGSTNPDSPSHWLNKFRLESKKLNYVKWSEHDNITSGAKKYYEDLRDRYRNNPAYLSRYVHGEWAAADGLVYTEFNDKFHLIPANRMLEIYPLIRSYKIGVDFATSENSATAIVVIGVTESGEYIVVREVYQRGSSITQTAKAIRELYGQYHKNLTKIYIDPAANHLIKHMKEEGMLIVQGGNNSVMNGIDYVKDLFNQDKLYISDTCTNLIDELYTYSYSSKENVNVVKENDHACDALRYGLYS